MKHVGALGNVTSWGTQTRRPLNGYEETEVGQQFRRDSRRDGIISKGLLMTPFALHCDRWKDGCGTRHCDRATKIVIARGKIPADVMFIGEAPGVSEDVRGIPFDGPAGALLDQIIEEAFTGYEIRTLFANLVGCLPHNDDPKNREPDREQIESCNLRLKELVDVVQPKLVVAVGSLAEKNLQNALGEGVILYAGTKVEGHSTVKLWTSISHPARVLRSTSAQKSMLVRGAVATLAKVVKELYS